MKLTQKIRNALSHLIHPKKTMLSEKAYNLWASTYDDQTDNPILYLDDLVFDSLLSAISVENKIVVDFGCGTGRHWKKLLEKKPAKLIGYDTSNEMLNQLQKKFPQAETHLANDNSLKEITTASCDIIISTLVIGYIKDLSVLFREWDRVLKPPGDVIITDFHPVALENGADRSMKVKNELILIKNHLHSLHEIKTLADEINWKEISLIEEKVDEKIKHFYRTPDAIAAYQKSYYSPLLYGFHFKKR